MLLRILLWISVAGVVQIALMWHREILGALSFSFSSLTLSFAFFMGELSNTLLQIIILVDLTLAAVAGTLIVNNNAKTTERYTIEVVGSTTPNGYEQYTAEKYNKTVSRLFDSKGSYFVDLFGATLFLGSILTGGPVIRSLVDNAINTAKLSWLVSAPHLMLQNVGYLTFNKDDFTINREKILTGDSLLGNRKVIFILPTNGKNPSTVMKSTSSALYWSRNVLRSVPADVCFYSWVVCEEKDYRANPEHYAVLKRLGVRVVVVPEGYTTPNGAQFKARALAYANQVMKKEGFDTNNVWIYHQDDETMVGEDTILGILDFIQSAGPSDVYAAGIIIYADGLKITPSRAQEPARSYDDLRILFTTRTNGLLSFGHHGSHLLVRADAEISVGWDFGKVKTEDWLFGLKLWQRYSPANTILKGFAYEKPPLTTLDLLRQRRRWAIGAAQIITRRDVRLRYRLAALYGLVSWFSALPSLVVFVANLVNPTGGLFYGAGLLAGFTWFSLLKFYTNGYMLNNPYFKSYESGFKAKLKKVSAVVAGMFLESIAPWYALVRPAKKFEVIKKDE